MEEEKMGKDYASSFVRYSIIAVIILVAVILYLIYPYLISLVNLLLTNPSGILTTTLFKLVIFPGLIYVSLVALIAEWVERKLVARIQVRVGPLYVGGWEGLLQPIADLFKLITKEIIIPKHADKNIFILSPILAFIIGALPIIVVPYSPTYVIWDYDFGLLLFFAILAFYPLVVLLAAWSSNNKYSFIGGLRALYQQASYEVPLFLAALPAVMLAGSFSLTRIAEAQSKVWFILFAPLSAIVFFAGMMAELERIPFDMPEADSELVSGWTTEYSGIAWGLYQFAAYVKLLAYAGFFVTVFLGGWQGISLLPPLFWSLLKVGIVVLILLSVRGFFPRIRIDQLVRAGWGRLIPICIINIVIIALLQPYIVHVVG
ncbi:MAG: NADH-quinone oxidoreductase subunit NuoH [Conexivisphaerales archaeon]